jgi:hypothetical protein
MSFNRMQRTLQYEEATLFLLGLYFFQITDFSWWWFPLLLFTPDIGMLGYLVNTKIGAAVYNTFHHRGIAIVLLITGYTIPNEWVLLTGIILFAHASLDRVFGYGLKYPDDFKHTHLGWIGGEKAVN